MIRELARSFQSLTTSPLQVAVEQAHKLAKQHLESGGAAGGGDEGVVLPADVNVDAVVAAITAAFSAGIDRRRLAADALVRRRDGRFLVRRDYVRRLGDGDLDRGKRRLERLLRMPESARQVHKFLKPLHQRKNEENIVLDRFMPDPARSCFSLKWK
jgi:hypothetical protein